MNFRAISCLSWQKNRATKNTKIHDKIPLRQYLPPVPGTRTASRSGISPGQTPAELVNYWSTMRACDRSRPHLYPPLPSGEGRGEGIKKQGGVNGYPTAAPLTTTEPALHSVNAAGAATNCRPGIRVPTDAPAQASMAPAPDKTSVCRTIFLEHDCCTAASAALVLMAPKDRETIKVMEDKVFMIFILNKAKVT